MKAAPDSGAITGRREGRSTAQRARSRRASFCHSVSMAIGLALAVSLPLLAEQVRIYQDGNTWVEETTGTLPAAHDLRVNTDVGSIDVRGRARGVMYTIRKRVAVPSKEEAEREFKRMKISAAKVGDQVVVEGRSWRRRDEGEFAGRRSHRKNRCRCSEA